MDNLNPWKGLQSYQENDVIWGRDEEIRTLYTRIAYNTQTVVYGKSGIGKTSIINAGIIPRAKHDGFLPISIRLAHTTKKNQEGTKPYVEQIQSRIKEEVGKNGAEWEELVPHSGDHSESLWELMHRFRIWKAEGEDRKRLIPLLLFDQFEEIFTLEVDAKRVDAFFADLADLLNEIKPDYLEAQNSANSSEAVEESSPSAGTLTRNIFSRIANKKRSSQPEYLEGSDFRVVITLREDFLSYLERFTTHIPVMKQNRCSILPMNEEQAAIIIMEPIPGFASKEVAQQIIQKVTGRKDFKLDGVPEIEVDSALLSLYLEQLYKKVGGAAASVSSEMVSQYSDDIIKNFYEESIAGIPDKTVYYLEDALITNANRRDNVARIDLISGGVDEEDLDKLLEKKLLRQFSYSGDLRIEFIHDILCPIVNDRIEHREQLAKEKEAERLQEEERKRQAEKLAKMEEKALLVKQRNQRRIRTIVLASVGIVLFTLGVWFFYDYYPNRWLHEAYYSSFDQVKGWPVGIGDPLSQEERSHTHLYYRLSHRGNRNGGRHTDVAVCSSNEVLPNECRLPFLEWTEGRIMDNQAAELNAILSKVAYIHYSANEGEEDLSKEEYLDEKGNLLLVISYFYQSKNDAWAQFFSAKGQSLKIRANKIDRKMMSWDPEGRIKSVMYYDAQGVPQIIFEGINGYLWEYYGRDTSVRYALNAYGLPTTENVMNTVTTVSCQNATEVKYGFSTRIGGTDQKESACSGGYSRVVRGASVEQYFVPGSNIAITREYTRDQRGNIIRITTKSSTLVFPPVVEFEYDGRGLLVKEVTSKEDGSPFPKDSSFIYKTEYSYDAEAGLCEEKRTNTAYQVTYHYKKKKEEHADVTVITTTLFDPDANVCYLKQIDSVGHNTTSTTFWDDNSLPVNVSYSIGKDTMVVHRVTITRMDNVETDALYRYADNAVVPMETDLDVYGRAKAYFRRIIEYDDAGNTISLRLEDKDGKTIKSMMYFIQNGKRIGRAVKGIDGDAVRCDKWEEEGYLYYKFYYSFDFENQYTGLTAVDEWENRSSIWNGVKFIYLYWLSFKDKWVVVYDSYKDIFKTGNYPDTTKIFKQYDQVLFKSDPEITSLEIPFIHVLSPQSIMYDHRKGIIDNDRLIGFGSWKIGASVKALEREWTRAMRGRQPVHVIVLRPCQDAYSKLEFDFTLSDSERDNIEYHVVRQTAVERSRISPFLND